MHQSIDSFASMIDDVRDLESLSDTTLETPVATGKWSTREIIAHLIFWDKLILEKVVPNIASGAVLPPFPEDYKVFNEEAVQHFADYKTKEILTVFISGREQLIEALKHIDGEVSFEIHGFDKPFTTESFIALFAAHDQLHVKQIKDNL